MLPRSGWLNPWLAWSPRHDSVPGAVQDKQYRWLVSHEEETQHGEGSARGRIVKSTAQ